MPVCTGVTTTIKIHVYTKMRCVLQLLNENTHNTHAPNTHTHRHTFPPSNTNNCSKPVFKNRLRIVQFLSVAIQQTTVYKVFTTVYLYFIYTNRLPWANMQILYVSLQYI